MAKWSDVITLIKSVPPTEATNENGFAQQPTEQSRSVFCNKKSVGYSEFYKSQQAGYKAELKVDIYLLDYKDFYPPDYLGERLVEFEDLRYKVLRTYESRNGEFIELTLSDLSERSVADGEV